MSIKSKISTDVNGNIIIQMEGGFDYEYSLPLTKELKRLAVKNTNKQITIDLDAMDFVGSSGIGEFIATIKDLQHHNNNRFVLVNVNSEFQKVFRLYNLDDSFKLSSEVVMAIEEAFDNDDTDLSAITGKPTIEN